MPSPIISDSGISASAEELRELTRHARREFNLSLDNEIDFHDPESVRAAINGYLDRCEQDGVRPANLGMYAALGMSKQQFHSAITGRDRNKISPAVCDLLKKAKLMLGSYRESLTMSGKINPVTAIFWAKNYDQMSDVQTLEVSRQDALNQAGRLTPAEIARRIEMDVPIDALPVLDHNKEVEEE